MNICESCKTGECSFRKDGRIVHACHSHEAITRSDLAARDAEIDRLRTMLNGCESEIRHRESQDRVYRTKLTILENQIADLKRGEVVVQDVVRGVTHMGISWEVSRPGDYYWERGAWREWKADGQMANASSFAWIRPFPVRPIPADRELMRLVDELIRWHGLRPLDKRPDHAAVLVGAIKSLRAQPTQEPKESMAPNQSKEGP